MVGMEVLRASWLSRHMSIDFDVLADWDDEICPPWPDAPTVPLHVCPIPITAIDHAWTLQYHHGLSDTLQRSQGWQRESSIVAEALEKSLRWIAAAA
jgi:hypothetical protein